MLAIPAEDATGFAVKVYSYREVSFFVPIPLDQDALPLSVEAAVTGVTGSLPAGAIVLSVTYRRI
jgi:hypothetical protein